LMAQLLYGCGLRLMESIRLRIQDIDFEPGFALFSEHLTSTSFNLIPFIRPPSNQPGEPVFNMP
ncbi:MAG: hypothetical protein KAU94_08095, partial [Verrucomicrobia bacterium]|nr:hypothetical protein [Verrucomicrobiota bacterium]